MIRSLLALVLLTVPAWAMLAGDIAPPNLPGGPIQKFFVQSIRIDGAWVYHEEWRVWDGRNWISIMSDEGMYKAFGIKPSSEPAPSQAPSRRRERPIPRHQRDLE